MSRSKIEWTDRTWEPVQGCTKVSDGCRNCYAERLANGRMKRFYPEGFDKIVLREDKLDQPLHWRKPSKIFVCSRADLFHPDVPFGIIYKVIRRIQNCPQHTFQILTKRPERMEIFFRHARTDDLYSPNLWLGVSVENQKTADERIPLLLQCQAAVRFVSYEPALGAVDLSPHLSEVYEYMDDELGHPDKDERRLLDGVILGGESGPGARPMHPGWPRKVRDDCQAAGVPFFFKQWGEWTPYLHEFEHAKQTCAKVDGWLFYKVGKKAAGRLLDGRTWDELPGVLR